MRASRDIRVRPRFTGLQGLACRRRLSSVGENTARVLIADGDESHFVLVSLSVVSPHVSATVMATAR